MFTWNLENILILGTIAALTITAFATWDTWDNRKRNKKLAEEIRKQENRQK
jgi:hypothetical protein